MADFTNLACFPTIFAVLQNPPFIEHLPVFIDQILKNSVDTLENGLHLRFLEVLEDVCSHRSVEFEQMSCVLDVGLMLVPEQRFAYELPAHLLVFACDELLLLFNARKEKFLSLFFHEIYKLQE